MEQNYFYNKRDLSSARITFWVYAASVPIVIFLYILPALRGGSFELSLFGLILPALILYLIYGSYRTLRVLLSVKNTCCKIDADTVSGVSTPNPFRKSEPFEIRKSDILGIGKTAVPIGGTRELPALVLNTAQHKYVLLAIDRIDELRAALEGKQQEQA